MRLGLVRLVHAALVGSLLLGLSASYVAKAGPSKHFPFARIEHACGPTDGPAFQIYFTAEPTQCGPVKEHYLIVTVNESFPTALPRSYSLARDQHLAGAARCLRQGAWESATSGTLRLTAVDSKRGVVRGEYEFNFPSGPTERASFEATWCRVMLLCG